MCLKLILARLYVQCRVVMVLAGETMKGWILDIKYKFLIPPSKEDLNVSGISSTIGLKIPIID
jgi:hypothetical protein